MGALTANTRQVHDWHPFISTLTLWRVSMLTTPLVSSTEVQENYASFHQPKSAARQTQPHYQDLVRLLDAIVWRRCCHPSDHVYQ